MSWDGSDSLFFFFFFPSMFLFVYCSLAHPSDFPPGSVIAASLSPVKWLLARSLEVVSQAAINRAVSTTPYMTSGLLPLSLVKWSR